MIDSRIPLVYARRPVPAAFTRTPRAKQSTPKEKMTKQSTKPAAPKLVAKNVDDRNQKPPALAFIMAIADAFDPDGSSLFGDSGYVFVGGKCPPGRDPKSLGMKKEEVALLNQVAVLDGENGESLAVGVLQLLELAYQAGIDAGRVLAEEEADVFEGHEEVVDDEDEDEDEEEVEDDEDEDDDAEEAAPASPDDDEDDEAADDDDDDDSVDEEDEEDSDEDDEDIEDDDEDVADDE